jgi:hypothetical protein
MTSSRTAADLQLAGSTRWIDGVVCAAVGIAMLAWTWRTWPDVLVDFGGELYVPWRLSEGDVLYRDVAYFTGPLSPYVNALWFRIFGASFLTLAWANIAVIAAIAVLLHRLSSRLGDRASACAATVVFLVLFAFAELEAYGNSNYVAPYAHETTHGTLIALAALACLERWMRAGRRMWIGAVGFAIGLSFLTKVEYFLAVGAMCAVGVAGRVWSGRRNARRALASIAVAVGAMLVPPITAFAALRSAMGASSALRGTLGAWMYVFDSRITSLRFYRFVMGTDRPLENARLLFQWCLPYVAVLGIGVLFAFALRGSRSSASASSCSTSGPSASAGSRAGESASHGSGSGKRRALVERSVAFAIACAVTAAGILLLQPTPRLWLEAFRPLSLFTALAFLAAILALRRDRGRTEHSSKALLRASFCAFALVLLSKMVLNTRIQGYGYALAMPATIVACLAITSWIPSAIERRGWNAAPFRGVAYGVLAAALLSHLSIMSGYFAAKTNVVGSGADAIRADARGPLVEQTLVALRARVKPDDTLAVLPEGVMLNYWLRAKTPARYINYMPPELLMFGEDAMLADFEARPPRWIVLAHKSTSEYGLPFFGRDYGQRLFAWIDAHYAIEASFGDPPLERGSRFGLRILRRRT